MNSDAVDWRGYIPAITTPFDSEGGLDTDALRKLLLWLMDEGMHGLILFGTQGEWFTLTPEERYEIMAIARTSVGGKLPLIAGCNAYTARDAIANAKLAAENEFDGILLGPPPYMVPTERETLQFYRDVAAEVSLPMCVYNWPPGTNVDMSLSVLEAVADLEKVVAIKNSTPNLGHFMEVFFALKDRVRVFGIPMNDLGISMVTDHGAPGTMGAGAVLGRELPDFFNAAWDGDIDRARKLGARNDKLMHAWFYPDYTGRLGASQSIFKEALNQQGLPGGHPRKPLLPLDETGIKIIRETLTDLGRL